MKKVNFIKFFMTIGNHEYNFPNRLKINEIICMIPDTHYMFNNKVYHQ